MRRVVVELPDFGDTARNRAARRDARRRSRAGSEGSPISISERSPRSAANEEEEMKKLINAVDTVIAESLDGFAAAHSNTGYPR